MSINNVTGTRADISEILTRMREISSKTAAFSETSTEKVSVFNQGQTHVAPAKSFEDALSAVKGVFAHVSTLQSQSDSVKNAYIAGDQGTSLSQVLVAAQKSKLAFEGLVTVRNKILEAYKEIMNMPV